MAVQAGYLSNQILQHPLPPQSLVLLNNLLQHIKTFQMLTKAQQQMGPNHPNHLQVSVQITKSKQLIQNLHNQIAAQQAHHAKQSQHHGGGGGGGGHGGQGHLGGGPNNDLFKAPPLLGGGDGRGPVDSLASLQNSFGQDFLGMNNKGDVGQGGGNGNGGPHQQQQQSRLSQWTKIPSLEKDDGSPGDFSRAPGPQSNNGGGGGLLKSNSSLILGSSDK